MTDLLLTDGDLDVSAYDAQLVQGAAALRQQLALRLSIGVGEWFADVTAFVPWRQQILVRNPNLNAASALFRSLILATPSVTGISSFVLTFNNVSGLFRLDFTCTTDGEAVRFVAEADGLEALASLLLLTTPGSII